MKKAKDGKLWIPDLEFWPGWSMNYEKTHWNKVVEYISSHRVALDIGAHVGIWSNRMSAIFETVYAFEPLPKHIECFNENLKRSDNVILTEVGLSNMQSVQKMKELDFNSGSSSIEYKLMVKNTKHKQAEIDIETRTLDSFKLKNVDFIKMDVEGHEMKVIEGAQETLTHNSPIIFIEILNYRKPYENIEKEHTALNLLSDFGYCMEMHVGSGNYICRKR